MRVLVANFFPAFHPPQSGGEQRYYGLYRHLAARHDVTLLSPTYSNRLFEEVSFGPTFRELRIPKDPICDRLHAALDAQGIGPECSGYVVALAGGTETVFGRRFVDEVVNADVVIHESPFTLPYDRSFGSDGKPRIYNAYNVEHRLARSMLHGEAGARAADFIADLERALATHAARVFVTSEEDGALLAADFDVARERIILVPNGFEPGMLEVSDAASRESNRVLFIGSAHPPNLDAARFIVERLAVALPDVSFRIAGAAGERLGGDTPPNVRRLGIVDDKARARELARCALAINPMFVGSGTNLKALDYLAAGAPMLATPIGARGLGLADGGTAFIAQPDDFARRLAAILDDEPLRARVGAAGRAYVRANFTWEHIAATADAALAEMAAARASARPRLLAVNDFPVSAASGGGEVRIRELLTELAREFDVVLLALTDEKRGGERLLAPRFREIRVPRTSAHRDADVAAARGERVSVGDLVASEFCLDNAEFVALFRAIASGAQAAIFEHPYLVPLSRLLPGHARVVYSSLNVERRLKADLLRTRRDGARRVAQTEALEREMLARAGLVVCVSEADRREFLAGGLRAPAIVVENGVRLGGRPVATVRVLGETGGVAVFLGSAHPPNIEAARFLIERLAPALPSLDMVIAGAVCSGVGALPTPSNVHLVGPLATAAKNALLARADVALNPLFGGGGSSLKVPDFFAAGLPLVSTAIGVRGYDVRDGVHYVAADRDDFVERTETLVRDAPRREELARNARQYAARHLDWSTVGRRYREAMRSFLGLPRGPRILVVTYRFADPPPGGAETFLVNLLKGLARRGNVAVDVATCDVGTIVDHWHFSARYEPAAPASDPAYCDNVLRFAPDRSDAAVVFDACRRLFACWMAETRTQALELVFDASQPILLGGWNFAERRDGTTVRWASAEAHIRVTPRTGTVRIRAHAARPTRVEVRCQDAIVAVRNASGNFEWSFEVPPNGGVIALRIARPHVVQGDPRELGLLVEAVEFEEGAGWHAVPLDEDFESVARRQDSAAWVRSLIALTERRDPATDALFQQVRGPHSRALANWLEENVDDYDVVLAHGTPFSTAVVATEIAGRHGVPVVALPHVHMEDRYYHWQCYYAMFRAARCVIAAPSSAKTLFFDRIGAASVALPGGGVDLDEFSPSRLERARAAFTALHRGDKPFVLVLGRKTAAKRYRIVVQAVEALNASEHPVDLVLIGPDEDGQPIASSHVYSYGAQPRDVVLGALARALCLVNMSESESFGIVLLEAWLAGRPVVAARMCAAFAALVVPGENGVLADTPDEVARAIATYLGDEVLASRHANAGREVAQAYGWDSIALGVEGVLLEACRTPSPRSEATVERFEQ